jgi:hypothetical protein
MPRNYNFYSSSCTTRDVSSSAEPTKAVNSSAAQRRKNLLSMEGN